MKFAILDTYYQPVIDYIYQSNPTLFKKSPRVQKDRLLAQAFGTADFYSKNLISLGHQAQDFILNTTSGDVFLSQMKIFRPDIVYCQNLSIPGSKLLKQISPKPRLIVGQVASPTNFDKGYLSGFDLIITSFPHYVERFRKLGVASEYLPLAFEHTLLSRLPLQEKKYDTVFIGNNFPHHKPARLIFKHLTAKTDFNIWGLNWEDFGKSYHLEPVWGLPMFKIYQRAKIAVNRHIDAAENFANNMRLFEVTGVGTMLITDFKENLGELFEIGKEIETYKTKEELVDKIKYYLENESAREKIAHGGQKRTLKNHTYRRRIKDLVKILQKYV